MSKNHGSVRSYSIGFIISVVLTLSAYIPVSYHHSSGHTIFSHDLLMPLVLSLAVMQLFVQLIFFMHMGHKDSPRWNLIFFISTVFIILMVVLGSIWIMYHLNYNMMPEHVEEFIIHDEGISH